MDDQTIISWTTEMSIGEAKRLKMVLFDVFDRQEDADKEALRTAIEAMPKNLPVPWRERTNMKTTLSEACSELANLGFETIVPETIDGLALNEMSLMARHYLDATEFVSPEVISRVAEFVVAMLPEARRVSEEIGLQENMLKARVEHAKGEIDHWKERLAAFDRGEAVNYEYPDGSPVRPIENREKILGIIEENERVVANEGR